MKKLSTVLLSLIVLAFMTAPVFAAQSEVGKTSNNSSVNHSTTSGSMNSTDRKDFDKSSNAFPSKSEYNASTKSSDSKAAVAASGDTADHSKDSSNKNQMTMTVDKSRGQERVSQIIGMKVRNQNNENLGSINDMVVDKNGKIVYLILSHGGFLGIGDKLVPLPWNAVAANGQLNADKDHLVVSMTKDQLEKAPNFETKSWPNFAEGDWNNKVGNYFSSDKDKDNRSAGASNSNVNNNKANSGTNQQNQGKQGYTETH